MISNYVWRSGGDLRQHREILRNTVKEFLADLNSNMRIENVVKKWERVYIL